MLKVDEFEKFRGRAHSDCTALDYVRRVGRTKNMSPSPTCVQMQKRSPSPYRKKHSMNIQNIDDVQYVVTAQAKSSSYSKIGSYQLNGHKDALQHRIEQPRSPSGYDNDSNNHVHNGFYVTEHRSKSPSLRTTAGTHDRQHWCHQRRSPSPYRSTCSHSPSPQPGKTDESRHLDVRKEPKDYETMREGSGLTRERLSPSCYRSRGFSRSPSPVPSAHHARSYSCRINPKRPPEPVTELAMRPRTRSMPTKSRYVRPRKHEDTAEASDKSGSYYRLRSFSTSHKGIVNRGDSFKRNRIVDGQDNISLIEMGSDVADPATESPPNGEAVYRVGVVGSSGVGKSSLIRQFMTSEYMGNRDSMDETGEQYTVCVLVDKEESSLTFLDAPPTEEENIHAYIVVYAVNDYDSFDDAVETLYEMTKSSTCGGRTTPRPVTCPVRSGHLPVLILVANKGDIVRGRRVTTEEGKTMARRYSCKYIEVSSVLNHKVDELLVGVLKQIKRTHRKHNKVLTCLSSDEGCLDYFTFGAVGKLFRKNVEIFRSCDNVAIL